jgi:hypothetical protein
MGRNSILQQSCYTAHVRRLVLALMCLVATVTLGRGSIVHAMAPDFASVVATGDAVAVCTHQDQTSCKSHKAVTHQHHAACHGHKIGIPPSDETFVVTSRSTPGFTARLPSLAADARPDALIRPPTA